MTPLKTVNRIDSTNCQTTNITPPTPHEFLKNFVYLTINSNENKI